jgi:O-antigen ligase
MKFGELRSGIIAFIEKRHVYVVFYLLFVLAFFISPNLRWHCNFYYALIIPVYLISLQKIKFKIFFQSKIWLISMFLLLYLLMTILWAKNPGDKSSFYYLRKFVYLFVFLSLTMELVLRYELFFEKLFIFISWIGAATAFFSVVYFYGSDTFSWTNIEYIADPAFNPHFRLSYIADQLQNPISGAIIYGMIVLIIYFNVLKGSGKSHKWLYRVLMIIIAGSVLLTQSRGPMGALLLTFIIAGILTRDKKLLITLGCIIMIMVILFINIHQFRKVIATIRGFSYRIELAQKTLNQAKGNLLFGKGLTTDNQMIMDDGTNLHHTHNVYLGMILYGGITGLLIFLLLLAEAFREALKHFFSTNDITFFALILFAAVCNITCMDKIITHPHPLWFYFWLPLGLLAGVTFKRSEKYSKHFANALVSQPGSK